MKKPPRSRGGSLTIYRRARRHASLRLQCPRTPRLPIGDAPHPSAVRAVAHPVSTHLGCDVESDPRRLKVRLPPRKRGGFWARAGRGGRRLKVRLPRVNAGASVWGASCSQEISGSKGATGGRICLTAGPESAGRRTAARALQAGGWHLDPCRRIRSAHPAHPVHPVNKSATRRSPPAGAASAGRRCGGGVGPRPPCVVGAARSRWSSSPR
jgi:hypothetical protein